VYQPQIVYKSGRLHENADALSRYPVTTKGEDDNEDDLLLVFSAALGTERHRTRERQEAVPKWRKIFIQLGKREGRAHKKIVVSNGLLHVRTFGNQGMRLRLCVPPEQRKEILDSCHGDKWAAHLGLTRTINWITERYYWPRMVHHVMIYVKACTLCQTRKCPRRTTRINGSLFGLERPFQKVGIDVLGPFPVTTGGYVKIIVAVAYLTKWAETRAMRTATAREAAEFFVEDIVLRHGAPESVVTDCGKCFIADFTKEIM
jgi:hypothetical protein